MCWHIYPKLENCVSAERLVNVDESHETKNQPQLEYEQIHAAVAICYDRTLGDPHVVGTIETTYESFVGTR